jgi:hypothetical protein
MFGVAYAEQSSGATYTSPNGEVSQDFIDFVNEQEYIDHSHDVDLERDPEMGLGVDLVVWQNGKPEQLVEEVVIQGKYDLNNEESSAYVVARVNLFALTNK